MVIEKLDESLNDKINIKYAKTSENFNPNKYKSEDNSKKEKQNKSSENDNDNNNNLDFKSYNKSDYIIGNVESKMDEINKRLGKKYDKLKQKEKNNSQENEYNNLYYEKAKELDWNKGDKDFETERDKIKSTIYSERQETYIFY